MALTFKMIKPVGALIKKLGVDTLMENLATVDLEQKGAAEQLGREVIRLVCEKLEDCSDDIVVLCAAYKGVAVDEMTLRNPLTELSDLFKDAELMGFFKSALARAAQKRP